MAPPFARMRLPPAPLPFQHLESSKPFQSAKPLQSIPRLSLLTSERHELARIQNAGRIERALDRSHEFQARPMLGLDKLHLASADAVLARRGSIHFQSPVHEAVVEGLAARDLRFITHVAEQLHMEIAIAHMTDYGAKKVILRHVLLRLADTFSQPRNWHADVGGKNLLAGQKCFCRPEGTMPGLPKPVSVFLPRRPSQLAAAILDSDLRKRPDLLARTLLAAVKLNEKMRHFGQIQPRINIGRPDLQRVQELDSGYGNAGLNCQNRGVAGRFDIRKGTDAGQDRLRNAVEPERNLGDHAKGAFRADEQPREIIAGR